MTERRSKPAQNTTSSDHTDSVKVAVRVRPFNEREQSDSQVSIVSMFPSKKVVSVRNPGSKDAGATSFPFDNVFWSMTCPDDEGAAPATQVEVYREIGKPLIDHAFGGFNSCLFAYGQTGSGKTHTMMGGGSFDAEHPEAGVIPRLCKDLFICRTNIEQKGDCKWTVEVGFVEVYNEKVSDLLAERKKDAKGRIISADDVYLDVREHPVKGVFVQDQTFKVVDGPEDISELIELGNQVRHVAATKMNNRSSRSHAIFQIVLKEERLTTRTIGKSSRMNLVDLAGSERVAQSQVVGQQFNEAKFINLSLTTLGRVIDILADMSKMGKTGMPPYREAKLTYLLKDSLGGNSKTFMVAAVSPSAMNYDESMSTLRYASRARDIVNTAKMNEDPRAKRIRELEERIASMQSAGMLDGAGMDPAMVSEMESRIRMLQSEAQQQIAELQTLRLEREKSEMNERLHKATQQEKQQLQAKADELELQMRQSRAQAEFHVKEMSRLREEREEFEEKMRTQNAEMEAMQRQLSEMKDGQEQLKKTMAELSKAEQTKQEALRELEAQKRILDNALTQSEQSQEQRAALESQNKELELRIKQAELESVNSSRIRSELQAVQEQMDCSNNLAKRITAEHDELDARHFHEQAFLFTLIDYHRQSASTYTQWAEEEMITLRFDKETLQQQINRLTEFNAAHETTINDHQQVIQQLTAERDILKAKLEEATAHGGDLGAQLEQVTAQRDALTTKLEEATAHGGDLGAQLEQMTAQRDALTTKLEEATAHGGDLGAQLEQMTAQRDDLTTKLEEATAHGGDLGAQLEQMTAQRDAVCEKLSVLKGELDLTAKQHRRLEKENFILGARLKVQRHQLGQGAPVPVMTTPTDFSFTREILARRKTLPDGDESQN